MKILLSLLLFIFSKDNSAQNIGNGKTINGTRLKTIVITEAAIASISIIGLHYLWYKKFPHSRFHFFNDSKEWLNRDKAGHAATAYNLAALQYNMMAYAGIKNSEATWIGGLTALGLQTNN